MAGWRAAWAPFRLNELTVAVNPLKIREYLAAGLPTFCAPLPEVRAIPGVRLGETAAEVVAWLACEVAGDGPVARRARRQGVAGDTWIARAAELTRCVEAIRAARAEGLQPRTLRPPEPALPVSTLEN
jgi:hypothetical protein